MKKISTMIIICFIFGLIGCHKQSPSLSVEEIENIIEGCIDKGWVAHLTLQNEIPIQVYCKPKEEK